MLDVGAVANLLLRRTGFDEPVHQALCLLGTLHDIGKIGNDFRGMIEDGATQSDRHWQVSMAWFDHFDQGVLEPLIGSIKEVRFPLYAAAAGHHGGPPQANDRDLRHMVKRAGPEAACDAQAAIETIAGLFPDASMGQLKEDLDEAGGDWRGSASTLSWWVTGLVSVADWIGSNAEWFPPTEPGPDVADYWITAQKRAKTALEKCGIAAARPATRSADELFQFTSFTPMQEEARKVPIPPGQTLAVMEDATGSGKTEAALMLAQRMMQAGKGDGIFFALPTMATANAMFARLTAMRRMFDGDPSLALAHGRARLDERFRRIVGRREGEPDQEFSCAGWFADGRRKALLAQIGVGTIDQALLGVLPTRYFGLRLYALSQRVLIIDEAHDYDPYMQAELEALLRFHAMLGGSAILMTATLPKGLRQAFVNAFQKGAWRGETLLRTDAYPHLSVIGAEAHAIPVKPVDDTVRRVLVERVGSLQTALDILKDAADRGAACAFVRNSVDEAIAAVEALRARGVKAMLHHARFALCDRLQNEERVLNRFGQTGNGRAGSVIVGTQVLEQSLDIDFDVMVSDLAPMGALIQRAGRLWRHMALRPARRRPRAGPLLHVLSPDPGDVTDEHWSRDLLGNGWFVYPPPVQWRTAKALFAAEAIDAPDGLRPLIEAVDGADAPDVPDALKDAEANWLGDKQFERTYARQNTLNPLEDYRGASQVFSDEVFPTRLGPEQVTLVLARRTERGLRPLAKDDDPERAWALSEVTVSRLRWEKSGGVDQELPEIVVIRNTWKIWKVPGFYLCPIGGQGTIANTISYTSMEGLKFHA
jgi:CRISPR-associated endonuclease/helicase Cas3